MELTLVFVRHAHRDISNRTDDNGLDDKGHRQVAELIELLDREDLPKSQEFWSSPKKRCQETLKPLADFCNSPLKVVKELDEQTHQESGKDFKQRIFKFLETIKTLTGVIYLCSHGDWLPEAIQDLTGLWVDVKKGQSLICKKTKNGWKLH